MNVEHHKKPTDKKKLLHLQPITGRNAQRRVMIGIGHRARVFFVFEIESAIFLRVFLARVRT